MKTILIIFVVLCVISCRKDDSQYRYCQVKFVKNFNIPNYSEFYIDNIKGDRNNYGYGGNCRIGSNIRIISDTLHNAGVYVLNSSDFYLMIFNKNNDTLYKHLYQSTTNQIINYTVK